MTSGMDASFDDDYVLPERPDDTQPPEEDYVPRGKSNSAPRRFSEYRQPPADREAEQGVLGAMLISPNTVV